MAESFPVDLLHAALDDLDRVRMAAGYDHRVPMAVVIADVGMMQGIHGRAAVLADHPNELVRLVARHIVTAEPAALPKELP